MRVVFIEQESKLGGVEYTTLRVAQTLNKARFEPVIFCPEEGDLPNLARTSGLEVHIVPRPRFSSVSILWGKRYIANPFGFLLTAINVFRAMRTLEKSLRGNKADIVITKGLLAHFYGGLCARRLNIPCIWYVQEEVDEKRGAGLYRFILRKGAQKIPGKIVVDAEALLAQFGSLSLKQGFVEVLYNGIDTGQFALFSQQERQVARNNLNIPPDVTVIGQSGRIIPLKGQATLLQAFEKLAQDNPKLHLLFVGAPLFGSRDYEQKLRTRAAQLGLTNRVHFAGFVPDVRLGLAAMDIFVHASIETDSPVSLTEAMSCGLPVVVSKVRGTIEMVVPGVNALVFAPGDPDELASTLDKLLNSKQLQTEMGKQARETVVKNFSLQASVTRLESLMQEAHAA